MDRLTYRDDEGRARLTKYGMRMYCSTQATTDCFAKLEESIPRWIPVGERLPEDSQSVLVLRKDGGIFIWMYCRETPTEDVWIDDYCNVFSIYDSTHWMPLPEPPKEVGGEDG